MRYSTDRAFRQALEQRLKARAESPGMSLVRLRKLVTFDRFLARLAIAAPDSWLLKGGLALDYRMPHRFRTTLDLDISRQDDEFAAVEDFNRAQSIELRDFFEFSIEKHTEMVHEHDNSTVRYHLVALLADRPFEQLNVDVSFSDPRFAEPEVMTSPPLLNFAGIDPTTVRAIPLEQHVAEKVHAYTKTYLNERRSTRAKDLVDLVLIAETLALDAQQLRAALNVTFDARHSHPLPPSMPRPPQSWETTYPRIAQEVNLSSRAHDGYLMAAQLLDPIMSGAVPDGSAWNPVAKRWE